MTADHAAAPVADAGAFRLAGLAAYKKGNAKKAVDSFLAAVKADPRDHVSLNALSEIFFEHKEFLYAIEYAMQAVLAEAADDKLARRYKQRFLQLVTVQTFETHSPKLQRALEICLASPDVNCGQAQKLWHEQLLLSPTFSRVYRLGKDGGFDAAHFDRAADYSALLEPFFLLGLQNLLVNRMGFEEFLVHLRSWLLREKKLAAGERLRLAAALSHYCLFTDYIFVVPAEEETAIAALRAAEDEESLVLLACYEPLHKRVDAEKMYAQRTHFSPEGRGVLDEQVGEWLDLQARREKIVSLTEIDDGVSRKVQAMYETFPYPRWKVRPTANHTASALLPEGRVRILVAGCGTGQDPISYVENHPQAEIVAVDLSRASLAYAMRKAEEFGITNIAFRHGDILKLGDSFAPESFDFIASMGVLHHMKEPLEGWRVLSGLLKKGGTLRLGLYSKAARKSIVLAREIIAEKGYSGTAQSMRAFREGAGALLPAAARAELESLSDYYNLSMYNDLLFHVQEHRTDIAGIQAALADAGLVFDSFLLPFSVMPLYMKMFPGDRKANDLERWKLFERKYPEAFIGMYQFWCKKPG